MVKIYELFGFKELFSGKNNQNIRQNGTYICFSCTNYDTDKEMFMFLYEIHDVDLMEDLIEVIELHVKNNKISKLHICIYQDDLDETLEDIIIIHSEKLSDKIKKVKKLIKEKSDNKVSATFLNAFTQRIF